MPTEQDILNDPCASKWLKVAIITSGNRDIVDALNDAEFLVKYLKNQLGIYPKAKLQN